jgi:predicted RecB family nuclease
MIISSQLFEAYLECSTKCWLRSRAEPATGNSYAEWARPQNETYLEYGLKRSFSTVQESDRATTPPIPKNSKDATWCLATDVRWRTRELESRLQAVERIPSEGHGRPAQFIPYRFEFANKLAKEHKLLLAFDALLLSEVLGREVNLGKIVHGDSHATLKVKIPAFASEVRKRIKEVTALLASNSPPALVLNRHCGQCEFKTRCSKQAREKDELSQLSGISEKDRKRLHSKGIFTVTQLSYTFRPRRRRRESKGKQEKHHHSFAGACNPRKQNPRRRHSGPNTQRHSCLSGCRRATRPRFLLLDRYSNPNRRRKRSTQFLGRQRKRGEADME